MTDIKQTQYVVVKFNPWDRRTYTYQNNGEPVAPGDMVDVDTPRGRQSVKVEEVNMRKPSFTCKDIVGKTPPKADPKAEPDLLT